MIGQGTPLPDFAYQVPLLSLPAVFCTTVDTAPACVPYLSAEPRSVEKWGRELATIRGFRVGIVWQGSQRYGGDAHRSAALREFAPLAGIPGVQLISLQKGPGVEQLRDAAGWNIIDLGSRLDDFADTAAVMKHLDLVISVDTAVVHLAGALGVPAWVALCTASDWRWLLDREDSPWYPTVRLFRQRRWGDWAGAFGRMADALRQRQRSRATPIVTAIAASELFDKIAALEVERSRLRNDDQLVRVQIELGRLVLAKSRCLQPSADLDSLVGLLRGANDKRQEIEEDLDAWETQPDDGERQRDLATLLLRVNRRRCEIKRQLDELLTVG